MWKILAAASWTLPLTAALACALFVAGWLVVRNSGLHRELVRISRENEEHQQTISSLRQQESRLLNPASPRNFPPPGTALYPTSTQRQGTTLDQISPPEDDPMLSPVVRLRGVSRGLSYLPRLHIGKKASMVSIVFDLKSNLHGPIHEEIRDSEGKPIWAQQFPAFDAVPLHGATTIVLPAALFTTGTYTLNVGSDGPETEPSVPLQFRVSRDSGLGSPNR